MAPERARACAVRGTLYRALSDNDRTRAIEIHPIYAEILAESKDAGGDEDPA